MAPSWGEVGKHECLRTPTERVLHNLRELVIAVRHMFLASRESRNDICQGCQAPVHLDGLLESNAADI